MVRNFYRRFRSSLADERSDEDGNELAAGISSALGVSQDDWR